MGRAHGSGYLFLFHDVGPHLRSLLSSHTTRNYHGGKPAQNLQNALLFVHNCAAFGVLISTIPAVSLPVGCYLVPLGCWLKKLKDKAQPLGASLLKFEKLKEKN